MRDRHGGALRLFFSGSPFLLHSNVGLSVFQKPIQASSGSGHFEFMDHGARLDRMPFHALTTRCF